MPKKVEKALGKAIIETALALQSSGLNEGTAGNISLRCEEGLLITPTGVAYSELTPEHIVKLTFTGEQLASVFLPSSEWRIHADILAKRLDINAIIHTHSPYATAIACTRQGIPAFHYMVAVAGGDHIPCAEYATFGTAALSDRVIQSLGTLNACLLANHGVIALGADLKQALKLTKEVEFLAKQYCLSLQVGKPILLNSTEMAEVITKFKTYGKQTAPH